MNNNYNTEYPLILLVGPSGSGKTTIAEALSERYGNSTAGSNGSRSMGIAKSYTTRKPRFPGEDSYHFVSKEEFGKLDLCDKTEFCGNMYGLTQDEVERSGIIICDPNGIINIRKNYKGERQILVVFVTAPKRERYLRMISRGDGREEASKRIENDEKTFHSAAHMADFIVFTQESVYVSLAKIEEFIAAKMLNTFVWFYGDNTCNQSVLAINRNVFEYAQILQIGKKFCLAADTVDLSTVPESELNEVLQKIHRMSVNESIRTWPECVARPAFSQAIFERDMEQHIKATYKSEDEAKEALRTYKANKDIFMSLDDRAGWNSFAMRATALGYTPDIIRTEIENIANA